MPTRTRRLTAIAVLAALGLGACGSDADSGAGSGSEQSGRDLVTSFYPLAFITSRVAADLASVETLTSPGVDPHEVELSPRSVGTVKEADLVVYSSGLQQAVDEAVEGMPPDQVLDVNQDADLVPLKSEDHDDHDEHEGGGEHEETGEHDHDHEGGMDPHFWLDPQRMASVTRAVADQLSESDPDHAPTYKANADALVDDLDALQAAYDEGLAQCEQQTMVTTHEAFGYIARAHDFEMVGIAGVSPESEPGPARLAEVAHVVEDTGVDVVYSEVLLSQDIAETVASETGTEVLLLDPLEGLTEESPGSDYLSVMRSNLQTLRQGQKCL